MGSPSAPDPVVCFSQPHGERFGSLLALPTRAICGLYSKFCLMMIYSKEQGMGAFFRRDFSRQDFPPDSYRCVCPLPHRRAEHAQHRHPVVCHPELGIRRQHPAAEEQAERAAHQLHSVFTAPPGMTRFPPEPAPKVGWGKDLKCLTFPAPPAGEQLRLGTRRLPALHGQQVWSYHRLQQPLHQQHGGFPWRRPSITFRLHTSTQTPPQTLNFISHVTAALETISARQEVGLEVQEGSHERSSQLFSCFTKRFFFF